MKTKGINNLGLKIISVILAVILWFIVLNVNDPVATHTFRGIEVKIINEEAISGKNKTYEIVEGDTVDVSVEARRSVLAEIRAKDIRAVADLSKLSLTMAVPIDVSMTRNSSRIQNIQVKNNDILKLKLEDMVQRQFPITVVTTGEPDADYVVGNRISSPNIVTVEGAKSAVNGIAEARVTVSVHGAKEPYSETRRIEYYDEEGQLIRNNRLTADAKKAKVSIEFYKTKEVDLNIHVDARAADGYEIQSVDYEPKKVTIAAPDEVLEKTESVSIDDIRLRDLTSDFEQTYNLNEHMPEQVMATGTNPDAVISVKVSARENEEKKR